MPGKLFIRFLNRADLEKVAWVHLAVKDVTKPDYFRFSFYPVNYLVETGHYKTVINGGLQCG